MPELKDLGVSVHIIVDDKPLEEYGTEVKEGKKSTCYIASQEGQQFKISIKNDTTYELQLWAFMDGNDTGGLLAYAGKTSSKRGLAVSETSTKPYVFTKLEMTDDDTVLATTKKISAKLGVIELRVQRVVTGPSTSIAGSATQIDTQPVHERSKKAGCHRVSLGAAIQHNPTTFLSVRKFFDSQDNPYAHFSFIYRPLELLQAQGIAPRSNEQASTDPKGKRKEVYDLTEDPTPTKKRKGNVGSEASSSSSSIPNTPEGPEDLEKLRKLEEMKKKLRELKNEIDHTEADIGIKRESSPIHVPPPTAGKKRVVIDLTL